MKSKNRFYISFGGSVACHVLIVILLAAAGLFAVSRPPDSLIQVAIVGGGGGGSGGGTRASAVQAPIPQPREIPPVKPVLPDDIVENKEEIQEKTLPVLKAVPALEPVRAEAAAAAIQGGGSGEPGEGRGLGSGNGSGNGNGGGTGDGAGEGSGPGSGIGSPAVPPRIIYHRKPAYPNSARNREIEGTTVVRLLISTAGNVEVSSVEKSSGSQELDAAATNALQEWKFVSAKDRYGRNMRCYVFIPIKFRLR